MNDCMNPLIRSELARITALSCFYSSVTILMDFRDKCRSVKIYIGIIVSFAHSQCTRFNLNRSNPYA